mgnify:CR=1 FL=1
MGFHVKDLPDLTFTGTSTVSNAIGNLEDCEGLMVYWSSSTGTTMTFQVSPDATSTATFGILQSGGADVTITAAESVVVSPIPFRQLRLLATAASTGSLFRVSGQIKI